MPSIPAIQTRLSSAAARTSALLRLLLGVATLAAAVAPALHAQAGTAAPFPRRIEVQAVSLLGDTLRTLPLSATVRARYEAQLADARRAYEHAPAELDSIIWYARRLAYVGQLREAIEVYTRGLAVHPDNPWLL